jgi:hypothetical protein
MNPRWWGMVALAALVAGAAPAAAQETAFKGGVSISRFQTDMDYWDANLVTTTFGGHVRLRLLGIHVQPELHVLTKGATASQPFPPQLEEDQIRLEYIEIPLLIVLPIRAGPVEPFIAAGPTIMLESRCRSFIRQQGLRTNLPCDPPDEQLFSRRALDWGATASAGAAYPLLGGRVFLEARHTWGLRDIHAGPGDREVFNRTLAFLVGFGMGWEPRSP